MNRPGNEIYIYSTENTIDDVIAQAIKAKIHPPGTVIFPKIGGAIATNKRRILIRDTATDNNVLGIIPNDSIDSEWLYHFLRSIDLTEYQSGTSVPSIKQSVIEKIPAPLLPKNVQVSIASFLSWVNKKEDDASWENAPQLPPLLDEQRRIVARIEELAAKIEEAQKLRRQAAEEAVLLWANSLNDTFSSVKGTIISLEKACEAIIDNLHSTPKYEGDEYPCIRSQDVGWGTINYSTALRTSEEEFIHRTRRGEPKAGDIVYVREGDVGRCAVVDGSQRFSLGQRVMMLRPNHKIIDSQFLILQLMSPPVLRDQVLIGMTGTTSHHVNIKHLKKVNLRVPPLDEQRRIVARLDELQAQVDRLKKYQVRTAEELDALLPSVLDRAFRGQL